MEDHTMNTAVDAMRSAYDDLLAAAVGLLEAHEADAAERKAATDAALEDLKDRLDLLAESCDRAEALVYSARQLLVAHCAAAAPPSAAVPEDDECSDESAASSPTASNASAVEEAAE